MKEPYNYMNEYGDTKVIPLEDIKKCCKDKKQLKMMEILLHDEKEKYFLKLAQEGEKISSNISILKQLSHKKKKQKHPSYKNNFRPFKRNYPK